MNPTATTHHDWLPGRKSIRKVRALTGLASALLLLSSFSWGQEPNPLGDGTPREAPPPNDATTTEDAPQSEPARTEQTHQEQPALIQQRSPLPRWIPEIHGFVSQGFLLTSRNNFLAQSERGSFEFSEVGLNFTEKLTDRFRIGMQLFMRDLGPLGNYKPQFDWFYLDYKFFDWLGLRAGRTKIPFGLYNESNDIDSARVPILLPQAMYPTQTRDYLLAQTGLELYGRTPYTKAGALEYRAYGGTIFLDNVDENVAENLQGPYVAGARILWETPWDGLRLGGTYQRVRMDWDTILPAEQVEALQEAEVLPPDASNRVAVEVPVHLWAASVEYSAHNLLLAAEYGRWYAKVRSSIDLGVPKAHEERMYAMASYQVAPWFTPGAYYALYFPDVTDRKGAHNQQHDVALTLRFDPIEHWLFKLEGHFLSGTAYLRDDELNPGKTPDQLARDWLLFMAKTTAYF